MTASIAFQRRHLLAADEVKEAMAKQGNIVDINTPEFALEYFKKQLVRHAALVKKAGVVPA